MPRKVFTAGEILTAANLNDVSDATVMVFDDATARTTAIPTPVEGMVTYLSDVNQVQAFTGSAFTPVGTILQVVSTTKTDTFTSSSTTFTDITGLTVSITPTATSSKVYVTVSVACGNTAGSLFAFQLVRDSTAIAIGDAAGSRDRVTMAQFAGGSSPSFHHATASKDFLDSPNSTSALTYKLQGRTGSATFTVNRNGNDGDAGGSYRAVSSISVMEVAG